MQDCKQEKNWESLSISIPKLEPYFLDIFSNYFPKKLIHSLTLSFVLISSLSSPLLILDS